MIIIDHFNKRFHFASSGNTFLTHSSSDFTWVTLNSSDEGMTEWMSFCSVVKWFENNGFASGVTAAGDERDFAGFQD